MMASATEGSRSHLIADRGTQLTPVRLLTVVRTWFWFLVAGTILGVALSFAFSAITPPSYAGQVTVLVTPVPTASGIDFSDIEATQALAPTFAELAATTPVLQRVIRSTGVNITPDRLALEISTRVPAGTSLIMISVTHPDPAAAASLANGIAAELEAYPTTGIIGQPNALQVAIVVVDPASPPLTPTGPGLAVRLALGGGIALFVCLALAVFVENLRQMRRTTREGRDTSPQWPTEPAERRGLATVHGGTRGAGRGWDTPDDLAAARAAAQPVATNMARPSGGAGAYIPPRQAPPLPIPLTPHERAAPAGGPEAIGDRFGSRPPSSPMPSPAPSPTAAAPVRLQPSTTGLIHTPDSPRPPASPPVSTPAPWSTRSTAASPAPATTSPTTSWPNSAQPHRGLPTIVPVVRVSERRAAAATPAEAGAAEPAAAAVPASSTPAPANRKEDGDGAAPAPAPTPAPNPSPVPTSTPAAKTASRASGAAADRRGAKGDGADRNGATAGPKGGKSASGRKASSRSGGRNQPAGGDEPGA